MAYREVAMWEILAVLERAHRGESRAAIARVTGHSRKTVRRYLATAQEVGWEPGRDPPTEALAAEVYRRHRPARERGPGEVEAELLPYVEQLRSWLTPGAGEKRGLKLTKVQRLLERQGIRIPYSSLHRFAVKHCDFGRKGRITVRMAPCAPGEAAEVDFGRLGLVRDPETGRGRVAWALVVVLIHSRHQYVHVTYSQRLRDVLDGLEDAWHFFGGVPRRVVLDNLKPAVTKADRYDPIFQRTCEEYARFRGFVLDATRSTDPQGKPHVERGVPYVRESFFRGETWLGLEQVQREARRWCLETAGTRIHGTTRERPLAAFENVERGVLLPLTGERFDPPEWGQYKVHPDHHISFQRALYSVPHAHLGRAVWVRADRKLVRIYVDGALVKTHARQPPGGRATDHADYPEELTAYTLRDPERMIHQARSRGHDLGRFMEALLSGTVPWAKLRQAQKLLRLGAKYGWSRVDQACRRALAFELVNVRRVEAILLQELDQLPLPLDSGTETPVIPIRLRFQRPTGSFTHPPTLEPCHDGSETLA
jgi:transposase